MNNDKLIAIVGTNASGKSALGLNLARHYRGEVVSADSRQIYRHLDLGTGKVTPLERSQVRHHLIDILDINQPFSLAEYQKLAYDAIDDVIERGRLPFLVGGTGLYTRAVVEGYDLADVPPNAALRRDLAGKSDEELKAVLKRYGDDTPADLTGRHLIRRIEKIMGGARQERTSKPRYDVLQLGLTWERSELYDRIERRLDKRLQQGMIEEVENLLNMGATPEFLEGLGLEYRLTYRYLSGRYESLQAFRDELLKEIRHFAKRQITWYKKEKNIIWLNSEKDYFAEAVSLIDKFILPD